MNKKRKKKEQKSTIKKRHKKDEELIALFVPVYWNRFVVSNVTAKMSYKKKSDQNVIDCTNTKKFQSK